MIDHLTIIKNWCASCGMPEPCDGECETLCIALTAQDQPVVSQSLTDGQIIDMANAAFSDQPGTSESRKDNDLFYLRTVRATLARQPNGQLQNGQQNIPEIIPGPVQYTSADVLKAYDNGCKAASVQRRSRDHEDAERYRWLRDNRTSFGRSAQHKDVGQETLYLAFSGYGRDVSAAIDAARAAKEE